MGEGKGLGAGMGMLPMAPTRAWQPPLSQAGAGLSLLPFHFKRAAPRLGETAGLGHSLR